MTEYGQLNIHWGWIWMVLGITSGMILGMWSFSGPLPTPPGHKDYSDLNRRLVRLAHIAMFMLPLINIVFGQYVDAIPVSESLRQYASYGMVICMMGVPTFLILASFYLPFKYVASIPVFCGFFALAVMSYGHCLLLFGH